eukprot:4621295-Pleurochrysis_carterae.AAC.1
MEAGVETRPDNFEILHNMQACARMTMLRAVRANAHLALGREIGSKSASSYPYAYVREDGQGEREKKSGMGKGKGREDSQPTNNTGRQRVRQKADNE